MKILIIEDEEDIRDPLKDLLEFNGHTVLAAADGPAGLELARRQPDLIFCDVGLPGMEGYQVLEALRKLPECNEIPFIFLTARAERQDQRRGMALGADDYITKPFTHRDILDAVEARVRRLRPLRERIERLLGERRSQVGANWSHELLTPLAGVMGSLEILEAEADQINPAELRELLSLIRTGAERQETLSRKLILHFELEQIKLRPRAMGQACDPADAATAGARQAAGAENRLADLSLMLEPARVALAGTHLAAAVSEVVGNSLRFSVPGQLVRVTGGRHGTDYRLDITDTGHGMTEEECLSFGPFIQFEHPKGGRQGLGLGLAIARSVAQLSGGRFDLAPGPGGSGLRVRFELPLVA